MIIAAVFGGAIIAYIALIWLGIIGAFKRWKKFPETRPTVQGWYRVVSSGDSESIDGHQIYSYSDYETWAYFIPDEETGMFLGMHDEDNFTIIAYYGPFNPPVYHA